MEVDNSPDQFFTKDATALASQARLTAAFRGDDEVRLVVGGDGLFSEQGLAWAARIHEQLEALPEVRMVAGPAMLAEPWPPLDAEALQRELATEAEGRLAGWISRDARMISTLLVVDQGGLDAVDDVLADPPPGVDVIVSGLPVLQRAIDQTVFRVLETIFPALVGGAALFLLVVFRSPRAMLAPLVLVGFTEALCFSAMGLLGVTLNMVNLVVAPLLFVIGLATAVHVLADHARRSGDPRATVSQTMRTKAWPILWTGATTIVAFGSLALSELPVVSELGVWCAIGIALLTAASFSLYPALLLHVGDLRSPLDTRALRWGEAATGWAYRSRWVVVGVAVSVMLAAALGLGRLDVGDDVAMALKSGHPVRADLETLQDAGMGAFPVEVLFERGSPDADDPDTTLRNPAILQALSEAGAALRADPRVAAVFGPGDLMDHAMEGIVVEGEPNEDTRWLGLAMLQSDDETKALLDTVLSPDSTKARLIVMVPALHPGAAAPLLADLRRVALHAVPDAHVAVAGDYPLVLLGQAHLLDAMLRGFVGTLLGVGLALLLHLRSLGTTLLVLIPNVLPVAAIIGGLGWLGIRVDSAAMMTASIVLGLAVDDTFHSLGYWRRRLHDAGPDKAIIEGLARAAPANLLTSLILALGMLSCTVSELVPFSRFGWLMASAVAVALVGDLLVLPATLALVSPKLDRAIRPLGAHETAWQRLADVFTMNIVVVLKLSPMPSRESIDAALRGLAQRHPLLRVRIVRARGRSWFVDDAPPIDVSTEDGDWTSIVERELERPFAPAEGPLMRVTCTPTHLVLTFDHTIVDGRSLGPLLDELVASIGGTDIGPALEPKPPAEVLLASRLHGLLGLMRFGARQLADDLAWRRGTPREARPHVHASATAKIIALTLEAEATSQLVRECRARRVTVHGALCAAMMLAVRTHLRPGSGPLLLRHFAFFDLRGMLSDQLSDHDLGNDFVMLRLQQPVAPDTEFWTLAKAFADRVAAAGRSGDPLAALQTSAPTMRAMLSGAMGRIGDTALSHTGAEMMTSAHAGLTVEALHAFTSNNRLGPTYTAQTRIFSGKLWWDIVVLDSDMTPAEAEAVAEAILALLRHAAGASPKATRRAAADGTDDVAATVMARVERQLGRVGVTLGDRLDDLGVESVDLVAIVADLEEMFARTIPEATLAQLSTVRDLVDAVKADA